MKTFSPPDYHKFPGYPAIAGLTPDRPLKRWGLDGKMRFEIVFKVALAYNCQKSLEQSVVPQAHE